ncbi:glutathione S-transferase family protein [Solimonas soli]|uniref:glutathione S-transferase family protein n=1 Tax=Solimonas soli TaxID=413479 RepID=UPI0005BE3FE5|nr:glutathione S-transferase family protein [Solimonas soli]
MKVNTRGEIVLTQMEISPFCDKVRRVLHYKGLNYSTREVKVAEISFLKRHAPTGKVPILDYGERRIWDSTDICLALEDLHPMPALIPSDKRARADVMLIEDWADETLYFFEMTMRFAWPDDRARWSLELAKRDLPAVRMLAPFLVPRLTRKIVDFQGLGRKSRAHVLRDLNRLLDSLTVRVADTGYCVGHTITLADISVAAQIHCINGSTEGAAAINARPDLAAWKKRIDDATMPQARHAPHDTVVDPR